MSDPRAPQGGDGGRQAAAGAHGGLGLATLAIHGGQAPDPLTGAVTVPIYQTSTFERSELDVEPRWEYGRVANPTRSALEANLALLEGAASGHAFASGMAAIAAVLELLESGDHVVVSDFVYGGTRRLFTRLSHRHGLRFSWVDSTDPEAVESAMEERTRLLFVETPSNPLMRITDLAAMAEIAARHGARLAVDNTLLTPCLQRPLELGAHLVVHSTTKYLNGHSDAIGGAVLVRDAADGERLAFVQKAAGAILAPFECFLLLRGIKTLPVRMAAHLASTRRVVEFLLAEPRIERVLYPNLADHPGRAVHERQARGAGGVVSFELADGGMARRFLAALELATLADSLGGVETLVSHPASMTHCGTPPEVREALGVRESLVRISVGLEDVDDLLADLGQALDRASG